MTNVFILPPNSVAQALFYACPAFELLYGGAAGGGKSAGLVALAAAYYYVPGYSALLLRETSPQLNGPGGLVPRSREIYSKLSGEYNKQDKQWVFESGASVKFGFMQDEGDEYNYQGHEYQFLGVDELTQIREHQYKYVFSRLRKKIEIDVPTMVRCTANPGSLWVYNRWGAWLDPEHPNPAKPGEIRYYLLDGENEIEVDANTENAWSRCFIPASWKDNPAINQEEYSRNLDMLPYVERQRLKYGRWDVSGDSETVFKREWFLFSEQMPEDREVIYRARFWDFAATEGGGDYTATAKIHVVSTGQMFIQIERAKLSWNSVTDWVLRKDKEDKDTHIVFEQEPGASGKIFSQLLLDRIIDSGSYAKAVPSTQSKHSRSLPLSAAVEQGKIYFVRAPSQSSQELTEIITEFCNFPNHPHDDSVDAASGCYNFVAQNKPGISGGISLGKFRTRR